jgi:copper homeostasis protein CutC
VEVCARLDVGGVTPDADLLAAAVATGIPCAAMARARAGSHVWAADEHGALVFGVERAKRLGARAVVVGAITNDRRVDAPLVARLVAAARPLDVVFHRAFDEVVDRPAALLQLADLGVARILASGGAPDAHAGRFELADLARRGAGRIAVLPGGGVRAHNAAAILAVTGVRELHSSTPFTLPRLVGPPGLAIRAEEPHDHAAVATLLARAFSGDAEARLVDRLRGVRGTIALVAELEGRVVGHVVLSPLRAGAPGGMGLAPLAVDAGARARGIGAALTVAAIARARDAGCALVVVLGDPEYYARFGFVAAAPLGLASRYGGEDGAFQALELRPGAADAQRGVVEYDPAFDAGFG